MSEGGVRPEGAIAIDIGDNGGTSPDLPPTYPNMDTFHPMPINTEALEGEVIEGTEDVGAVRRSVSNTGAATPEPGPGLPTTNVSQLVWAAGRQQVQTAVNLYANIDILRPYFDVTPDQVAQRLLQSFIPRISRSKPLEACGDLYGGTMSALTLVAVLLYTIKSAEHTIVSDGAQRRVNVGYHHNFYAQHDGTVMGTALFLSFGYWLLLTSLVYTVSYMYSTTLTLAQIAATLGYSLAGHSLVTLVSGALEHLLEVTPGDLGGHTPFYLLWLIIGSLTALRMTGVIVSHLYCSRSHKLLVSLGIIGCHMVFMLYLHWAYHRTLQVVNGITEVI